jgi:hypothetical protein
MRGGLAAEFLSTESLVSAIRMLRGRGVHRLEAYTPVPSHEIDAALGARRSPLAIAAGLGAIAGAVGGYFLQWLLVAYLYPVDVGSRPPHMPLPFTIITIEMGFLLGALTAVVAFVIASRLFRLWEPLFEVPGFESATRAAFWLTVDARDPAWDRPAIEAALRDTGANRVHAFGGVV